jgi:hypothetical protein
VYNYLEVWAVGATVYWQLVLGVILVTLVLAMPTGLVGTAGQLVARLAGRTRLVTCSRSGTSRRRSGTTGRSTTSR